MKADCSKYEDSGRGLLQFLEDWGLKIDHTTGIDGSDNVIYLPDKTTFNWKGRNEQVRINCKEHAKNVIEADTGFAHIDNGAGDPTRPYSFIFSECRDLIKAVKALKTINEDYNADNTSATVDVYGKPPKATHGKNYYRDLYKERFAEYIKQKTDEERAAEGRKPYSDATIKTYATDAFYLEKHSDIDFGYWFQSDTTMDEAWHELNRILAIERGPEKQDTKKQGGYFWDMCLLRQFFNDNHVI